MPVFTPDRPVRPRRALAGVALGAGITAALLLPPLHAAANEFGPDADGCCRFADNDLHTFFYDHVVQNTRKITESRRLHALDPTDIESTVLASLSGTTDVIVRDDTVEDGFAAYWQCLALNKVGECEQGQLVYHLQKVNNLALACQEIGHSVGLDHSGDSTSCMWQDCTKAGSGYTAHDRGHINSHYA